MIQIELPPYRGPRSLLHLVVVEIVFGRIFEAFRCISQVATASTVATDDDKPSKRSRQPM
jgi:hypothetical protein